MGSTSVYPDIAQRTEFTFDNHGYYLVNTLYLLPTHKIWLLGVLNSKITYWLYTKISAQIRGGFVRFIAQYVSQIPIPSVINPHPLELLVTQILAITKDEDYPSNTVKQAKVRELERQIDQMVYKLYELTPEEIAAVEGSR